MNMKKSLISLALLLTLAACDDDYESYTQNTPATFSGEQSAGVANDATSDVTGTLTVRDPDDGEDMATPQPATTTTYGAFTLAANGAWVYTLDTNNSAVSALASSSDMLTDTISVASVDGTTSNITITIVGVDAATPAIIGGELTKTMANDTASTTGTVTVTDPDEGEAVIVSQSSMATMYGTFSIADAGDWTYTLDTTNSEVMALATPSDRLTDTIAIESADGTTSAVVITITGPAPSNQTLSKVAKISDLDSGDSGELRYAFSSTLATGKITARFNKDIVVTDDVNATPKEAYIALWGSSTSTNNALVDLRIGNGTFTIRNKSDITITETFNTGEWVDVEMTWDATNASSTVAPLVTVTINGTSLTTTAFSSTSSSLADVAAGVQKLVLKLSDNGSIVTGDVYFDDINVYSDVAGLVPFWNENFEGFDADYDLALTYTDSATNEAIVAVK